jgi:hypothetical protein
MPCPPHLCHHRAHIDTYALIALIGLDEPEEHTSTIMYESTKPSTSAASILVYKTHSTSTFTRNKQIQSVPNHKPNPRLQPSQHLLHIRPILPTMKAPHHRRTLKAHVHMSSWKAHRNPIKCNAKHEPLLISRCRLATGSKSRT